MFGILFRVKAKPGECQKLVNFFQWDGEFCRDHEPGTLRFEFYHDPWEKDALYVYEAYQDQEAFKKHQKNKPYKKVEGDIKPNSVLGLREVFKCDALWSPVAKKSIIDYEEKWIEGLNKGVVSIDDEIFAPDCDFYITGYKKSLTKDKFIEVVKENLKKSKLQYTLEDKIMFGNKFAYRWVANDVSGGEKVKRREGLIIDRVAKGKVVERWEKFEDY